MNEQNYFSSAVSRTGAPAAVLEKIVAQRKAEKSALKHRLEPKTLTSNEIAGAYDLLRPVVARVGKSDLWADDLLQTAVLEYTQSRKIGYAHNASILFAYRAAVRAYWREYVTSIGKTSVDIYKAQEENFGFDIFPANANQPGADLDYSVAFTSIMSKLQTSRQADIFALFALGYSLQEIAENLNVNYYAVRRDLITIKRLAKQ
jgi:DNA-directed RNA polymerase specialized sigma24 family protein